MRETITISFPKEFATTVRKQARNQHFASLSEYFRHLVRNANAKELAKELHEERKAFLAGKGKLLKSLKDLR